MYKALWKNQVQAGDLFGIGRCHIATKPLGDAHCHDFAEVWWVDEGNGCQLINGTQLPVHCGDLVMTRPEDAHALGGDFWITNLFFTAETVAHLRQRYFPGDTAFWGGTAQLPACFHLTPAHHRELHHAADELARGPHGLLPLERFLLNLLDRLMEHTAPARDAAIPSWLQTACQQIRDPEQLRQGVQAFFQMTGKSPEHVARVVRQTLHTTPRDMVTEARMAHAAVLLDMTPQAIIDIANDCGYESLSRFYRVFKGAYNMTPRQYRRRMIGGSG